MAQASYRAMAKQTISTPPNVEIVPFDLDMIIHTHFRTDQIQTRYFEIASFEQLFAAVGQLQNSYEAAKV
jgi:phenylalanine-4-hydroxylase